MIDVERLGEAAERLKAFDADERGWYTEPNGFVLNASHLLVYMQEDITEQDFTHPLDCERRLAPDAVIFALRLGRWTGQAGSMLTPTPDTALVSHSLAKRFPALPRHQLAFVEATRTLRDHVYERRHPLTFDASIHDETSSARRAARLLMHSADLQAEEYGFYLSWAFDERLTERQAQKTAMIESR